MSFFSNKKAVAVIEETTKGDFLTPTATTFPINDVELPQVDLGINEYGRPASGKYERGRFISGAQVLSLGFTSFLIESPTPITIPCPTHPLFQMAGAHVVNNAIIFDGNPNCVTYSMAEIILACYAEDDDAPVGNGWDVRGMKTELSFGAEDVGAPIVIQASAQGAVEAHDQASSATLPTPSFADKAVDRFIGSSFTLGGSAIDLQSWNVTIGNTLVAEKNPEKVGLVDFLSITDVDTKITITSRVGVSTAGFWNQATGNTDVGDLIISGSLYTYTLKNCLISSYEEADSDGILVLNMELTVRGELEIVPNP